MEVKRELILNELAKGATVREICDKFKEDWGVTFNTMQNYIVEAMAGIYSDDSKDMLRNVNMFRMDNIYKEAHEEGDTKNALKALDMMNKATGAYEQTVKVDTEGDIEVSFNF